MERQFGVVVAGCGAMGQAHAGSIAILPEARLVGMVDVDGHRARQYALRYGAETSATSLDPFLARADVDAVVVATPNSSHCPLSIEALERGKHVLVQKPMSLTVDEADAMVAAADVSGSTLMVSFFELFHPAFVRAKEIVDGGLIGDVFLIKAIMAWTMLPYANWRVDPAAAGGGILMDGPPHHVALYKWLLDEPRVESVYAETLTVTSGLPVEDTAVIVIRTESALLELTGSMRILEWNPPGNCNFKESVEIFGTKGTIHLHVTERPSLQVYLDEDADRPFLGGGWFTPRLDWVPYDERIRSVHFNAEEDPWVAEHRHFFGCVRDGNPVVTDGRFGRDVMAVIMAAYEAAAAKRAVALPG